MQSLLKKLCCRSYLNRKLRKFDFLFCTIDIKKKVGKLKKNDFKDQYKKKIRQKGIISFVEEKNKTGVNMIKNLMQNHALNQP